jgi:hypothetical protein
MKDQELEEIEDYALKLLALKDRFPKDSRFSSILLSNLIHLLTLIGEVRELQDKVRSLTPKPKKHLSVVSITNDEIKFILKGQNNDNE